MKQLLTKTANAAKRVTSFALALTFVVALVASVTPQKASAAPVSTSAAPRVTFTFDDGLTSSITNAAPTLQKYGYSGTNYVITDCVGTVGICKAGPNLSYMTWDQIKALNSQYGWNIGSHTATHPYLASTGGGEQVMMTNAEVAAEIAKSKNALVAQGFDALDFAAPYGDYNNFVLAEVAKHHATFRGFADTGYNLWPYNDRLVVNQQVQVGVTVDQVKAYVDAAIAQNSWLVLTFHDIVNTAAEATAGDDYYYLTSQLDEIAAYVKSKNVAVVSPHDAIVNNDVNLLGDGSFDGALSTDRTQTNVWSTDDTTGVLVKKDGATNGSLVIGNTTSPLNSIFMSAAVNNSHLFSPRVAVTAGTTYTVKAFVNVTAMTGGEVAIYVDEYDAAGTYLKTTYQSAVRYSANANAVRVANTNFAYTPSAGATTAQVYVAVQGGFGIQAYIDNVQMFAPGVVTVPPTGKTGDITGDGIVNDDDATILFANWGSTPAAGDIDKNGVVNDDDATLLFANWSK